jgi:glutathionyl-hydroquinone reductase
MMEALKMETPMTEWNNDRLDELNGRMKEGFADVDKRFDKVDERFADVDKRFDKVDERFVRLGAEVKGGFAKVDKRFEKAEERFATRDEMSELRADFRMLIERFDRLYNMVVVTMVGLAGSLLASNFWG